jgi:hypothetical protein
MGDVTLWVYNIYYNGSNYFPIRNCSIIYGGPENRRVIHTLNLSLLYCINKYICLCVCAYYIYLLL